MPVTIALAARINQAMTPVACPLPKPADDVLEQPARRRVPGAELGERVALQPGDRAGDQERDPDRGAGHLAGRAEQREDPGADHGADADERGLADVQRGRRPVSSVCRVRHCPSPPWSSDLSSTRMEYASG